MTPDRLRDLTAKYARYVRLSELYTKSKLTAILKNERYFLRLELEDEFGMNLNEVRSDPDTPRAA